MALIKFLSLGNQPPSNAFLRPDQVPDEQRYPLDVCWCESCFLVQLLDVVPAETIFDDYLYASSTSIALKNHYAQLAQHLTARFNLKADDVVVDIGCNDGTLLHGYQSPGLVRIGVEPSKIAQTARDSGLEVIKAFFERDVSRTIVSAHGTAKIVTATNVFAHVNDIDLFLDGIEVLLGNQGVFVVEAPYLIDLIDQVLFDTIYHEHLSYLSLTPLILLLKRHGLQVIDIERIPFGASGPAIRVFIQKMGAQNSPQPSVAQALEEERRWGIGNLQVYERYSASVEKIREALSSVLTSLQKQGQHLGGYGAPAKGNTLLNYLGIDSTVLDCIAETNPMKQGLLTPGTHIPIVSEETFIEKRLPYALLLSWNYLDFFLEKSAYIRQGGRFLVPLPTVRLVP